MYAIIIISILLCIFVSAAECTSETHISDVQFLIIPLGPEVYDPCLGKRQYEFI